MIWGAPTQPKDTADTSQATARRVPNPLPLPPIPPISPFDKQFPTDEWPFPNKKTQTSSQLQSSYNRTPEPDTFRSTQPMPSDSRALLDHQQEQQQRDHHSQSSRVVHQQKRSERKVQAWMRSTTPELERMMRSDMPQGDDPHPSEREEERNRGTDNNVIKKKGSAPSLHTPKESFFFDQGNQYGSYENTNRGKDGSATLPRQWSSSSSRQPRIQISVPDHQSSPTNLFNPHPEIDPTSQGYLTTDQMRKEALSVSRSSTSMGTIDSHSSSQTPTRPGTFSRGFSLGDIHSSRLQEIYNPSTVSLNRAANNEGSEQKVDLGGKKGRPSFSSTFRPIERGSISLDRAEPPLALGGVPMERSKVVDSVKVARKQPSLMKGLRGSLFGLLHIGEGEEARAKRKGSRPDLRSAMEEGGVRRKKSMRGMRRENDFGSLDDEVPPLPSLPSRKELEDAFVPSNYYEQTLSSRSITQSTSSLLSSVKAQTHLHSPINLKGQTPGLADHPSPASLPVSDSIESLSSPPRNQPPRAGFRKFSEGSQGRAQPMFMQKTGVRLRSGSDSSRYERVENLPRSQGARKGLSAMKGLTQSISEPLVGIKSPARVETDGNNLLSVKARSRPRSNSWGASTGSSYTLPTVQALKLNKKRSEPILNSVAARESIAIPSTEPFNLRIDLQERREGLKESNVVSLQERRYSQDSDFSDDSLDLGKITGMYSIAEKLTPLQSPTVEALDILPDKIEIQQRIPSIKTDFVARVLYDQEVERSISPKTAPGIDGEFMFHMDSPVKKATSPSDGNSPSSVPRHPLPAVPNSSPSDTRKMGPVRHQPLTRSPTINSPLKNSLFGSLDQSSSSDMSESIRKRSNKSHQLPRLSYTLSSSRLTSQTKPRNTLQLDRATLTGQPRLVSVIFPSSAPAIKNSFDEEDVFGPFQKKLDLRTAKSNNNDNQSDNSDQLRDAITRLTAELGKEKEKRGETEGEMMRLHGRYFAAVKRLAQLELENDRLRNTFNAHAPLTPSHSFGSQISNSSSTITLNTPHQSLGPIDIAQVHRPRGDSMDTIDRLEVELEDGKGKAEW